MLYLLLPGELDLSFEKQHQPITKKRQMEDGESLEEPVRSVRRLLGSRRGGGDGYEHKSLDSPQQHPTTSRLQYTNLIISERDSLFCPVSSSYETSRHQKAFYSSKQIRSNLKPLILSGDCVPGRSSRICSAGKQVTF